MAKEKQGKGRVQKVITIVKAKGEPDEVSVERSEGKPELKLAPKLKPVPEPKLEPEPVTVAIASPQPVPASLPIPLSKGIRNNTEAAENRAIARASRELRHIHYIINTNKGKTSLNVKDKATGDCPSYV